MQLVQAYLSNKVMTAVDAIQHQLLGTKLQDREDEQDWQAAFILLLQLTSSSSMSRDQIVCRLACTSKSLAAAVAEHCTGRIAVHCRASSAQQTHTFKGWLLKHHQLVSQLGFSTSFVDESDPSLTTAIVDAMWRCEHLTALNLGISSIFNDDDDDTHRVRWISGVLPGLTALRSLSLDLNYYGKYQGQMYEIDSLEGYILPGLSGLTRLSSLSIAMVWGDAVDWSRLPAQLQALNLHENFQTTLQLSGCMFISHLTALKDLDLSFLTETTRWDELPPNLTALTVHGNCFDTPLLRLAHLEKLVLLEPQAGMNVEQYKSLTRLTALREVEVTYSNIPNAVAAAAGWSLLPVVGLMIGSSSSNSSSSSSSSVCRTDGGANVLPAATLQLLGGLRGLKWLHLEGCSLAAPHAQLDAALQQLSSLQRLQLAQLHWLGLSHQAVDVLDGAHAAGFGGRGRSSVTCSSSVASSSSIQERMLLLAQALAGLPQLGSVCLRDMQLDRAAAVTIAQVLGAASQITWLEIKG